MGAGGIDHHTYAWNGLWCTSYASERLAGDTKTVTWEGRAYWCHGPGSASAQVGGGVSAAVGSACGVERWAVKTLQDPAARSVSFAPRPTTVAVLRRLPAPATLPDSRLPGVERHSYRIHVRFVAAKVESDSDIHLVVTDPGGSGTMIVEFPAFSCTKRATRTARNRMQRARVAFLRTCGDPGASSFTELRGAATITGVGFFDFGHGQRGVAPNAIELHPVIGFNASGCS